MKSINPVLNWRRENLIKPRQAARSPQGNALGLVYVRDVNRNYGGDAMDRKAEKNQLRKQGIWYTPEQVAKARQLSILSWLLGGRKKSSGTTSSSQAPVTAPQSQSPVPQEYVEATW